MESEVTRIKNEILSCPICMELPKEKVIQCQNGHCICYECKEGLLECPQCRTAYGDNPVRNLLAEGILDEMLFPCTNKTAGCVQRIKRKDLATHLKFCAFRAVKLCPMLGFRDCSWVANTGAELRKHLVEEHKEWVYINNGTTRYPKVLASYMKSTTHWTFILPNDNYNGKADFVIHAIMTVRSKEDATFSLAILYLGDKPKMAQKYLGTLKVSMMCQNQEKCAFTWIGPVLHFKAAEDIDMVPCFSTPINSFKRFLGRNDKDFDLVVSFSVK